MARTLEARLASLKAQLGWRATVLTSARGKELAVPTYDLLDAWLGWQLREEHPAEVLRPRVSTFLAGARLRGHDGELLLSLQHACRTYWHERAQARASPPRSSRGTTKAAAGRSTP